MLEYRVLGPLEARGANGDVALGGRKQSLLLAVLLLRAGDYVSRAALIDALWPEAPPPSAASTLESYVSRLRRTLHAAGADREVIQSGAAGYRLVPDGSRIDLREFQRLLDAAGTALDGGEVAESAQLADASLALWRGPALGAFAEVAALRADAGMLEERRMEAVETFAEASLRAGRPAQVIARLSAEVARHPGREHLRALLMLALYRAGRQADALQAYPLALVTWRRNWGWSRGPSCASSRIESCAKTHRLRIALSSDAPICQPRRRRVPRPPRSAERVGAGGGRDHS